MRPVRTAAIVVAIAAVTIAATATPAVAHGVGGRADLPLPVWLFAYSAAFALLISFVALRILWPRPRLAAAAQGREAQPWLDQFFRLLRIEGQIVVLGLYVLTLAAAFFGVDSTATNWAPTALYVVFWVGVPIASAVLGDFWSRVNPLRTLALGLDRLARREHDTSIATGVWASHWPAAAGLLAFLWLELAYHEPGSVPAVALFLGVYSGAVLLGAARFGSGWVRNGDGFAVFFALVAALAPVYRDPAGALRLRWPGAGLAEVEVRDGTMAVVFVLLGGTAFDGFGRSDWWRDIAGTSRGWDRTLTNTIGLLLVIATMGVLFLVATRLVARLAHDDDGTIRQARIWVPSLVPIVLAYAIAHYFSLLVFEGQAALALLSDPLGEGWNWFGTADDLIDYTVVSPNQIAYVQVGSIVVGHVAGVIAAHDKAVERYAEPVAVRSQYPLLAVMIAYTVGGLFLLLNA